jgi:signal transduction histidine kinase
MAISMTPQAHGPVMQRIIRRILGVPLLGKVLGANVLIVVAMLAAHAFAVGPQNSGEVAIIATTIVLASAISLYLVGLALRPVRELERLASRISQGEFDARVSRSPFADADLAHLASTVNGLLDALAAERKRIQDLGAEVVYAQDEERSRASHELHDSIAQTLAAVRFQVAAASAEATPDMKNRLIAISSLLGSAMEDVRNVSYSLHPRVAEDLGLEAALTALAGQVHQRSGIKVNVSASIEGRQVPSNVSTTLFRVAQEALRNIEMHSRAKTANVEICSRDDSIRIEVSDDGKGFDQRLAQIPVGRSGLALVRDRVALAGGSMQVDSSPNGGTRVVAEMKTLRAAS